MANSITTHFHFLWAGLSKHRQTGGLVPSQRFLIGKMLAPVSPGFCGRIVELGAGGGALTRRLATRCPQARILACEINPTLARDNQARLADAGLDRRTEVVAAPAQEVLRDLMETGAEPPEYVISGIPLGNLGREATCDLIDRIARVLRPGGLYIQFQHSWLDLKKIRTRFADTRVAPVFLNLPPALVYFARR